MVPLGPHPLSIWTPNYEAMNQIPPLARSLGSGGKGGGGGKRRAKGQTENEEERIKSDTLQKGREKGRG